MKSEKKLKMSFKDKNNNLCKVKCEITYRNDYEEFSMTGEVQGGMGQCLDSIKPKTKEQKRLVELWRKHHLNGMNAGTPKQTKKIKDMKFKYTYDKACRFLNSFDKAGKPLSVCDLDFLNDLQDEIKIKISDLETEISILNDDEKQMNKKGLRSNTLVSIKELNVKEFIDHHYNGVSRFFKKEILRRNKKIEDLNKLLEQEHEKTMLYDRGTDGKLYKYGGTWHRRELPKNLWEEITTLKTNIEKFDNSQKITGGNWKDIDDYKIVALGKHLKLEPNESKQDISTDDSELYYYCGIEYFVLTEEEANERAKDYLGDEPWQMAVENGNTELGKKEWIEWVITQDGFGTTLNGYDGTEFFDDDNKVYIMRC